MTTGFTGGHGSFLFYIQKVNGASFEVNFVLPKSFAVEMFPLHGTKVRYFFG